MATISSNSLFHFTTKDSLFSILENEFYPKYSLQHNLVGVKGKDIAIPMVCFCDIPLSQIKNHVKKYGSYGIGMSKTWAQKKSLNPVLYLRKGSNLTNHIRNLFKHLGKEDIEFKKIKNVKLESLQIVRYLKPYVGDFKHNGRSYRNVRFYDEREWRYIPEWNKDIRIWISKEDFMNQQILNTRNEILKSLKLSFEPDDIKYIIVQEESEIYPTIDAIRRIKLKYANREGMIETLSSRIITIKQILEDF